MLPEQALQELRKELAVQTRIAELLRVASRNFADEALRKTYGSLDAAVLIKQSGIAEGAEMLIKEVTKPPRAAL